MEKKKKMTQGYVGEKGHRQQYLDSECQRCARTGKPSIFSRLCPDTAVAPSYEGLGILDD